jgi:hypothetical protein
VSYRAAIDQLSRASFYAELKESLSFHPVSLLMKQFFGPLQTIRGQRNGCITAECGAFYTSL